MSEVSSNTPNRELTFGEKLVGKSFNPSNLPEVDKAKSLSAELLDQVKSHTDDLEAGGQVRLSYEQNILKTEAINAVIRAKMAIVNYLTWKE